MQFFLLFIIKKKQLLGRGTHWSSAWVEGHGGAVALGGYLTLENHRKQWKMEYKISTGRKKLSPFFSPIGDGGLIAPFKLGLSNGKKKK